MTHSRDGGSVVRLCLRCRGEGALLVHPDGREKPLPRTVDLGQGWVGKACPDCKGTGRA